MTLDDNKGRSPALPSRLGRFSQIAALALFLVGGAGVIALFLGGPERPSAEEIAAANLRAPVADALLLAVKDADGAAKAKLATELSGWRAKVMSRVDNEFLDWHFGYMQRRGADLKWWWQRVTTGKETANETYMHDIAEVFQDKVVAPAQIQAEMDAIAGSAADAYYSVLVENVLKVRENGQISSDIFDREIRRISLRVQDGDAMVTQVALHDLVYPSSANDEAASLFKAQVRRRLLPGQKFGRKDLKTLPNAAVKVAAVAMLAVKTGVEVSAAVKALGIAEATASAIGTATAAVVVLVAVGAQEWWSHNDYVTTRRPKLRRDIDIALKSFTDQALKDKGRFGRGLIDVSSDLQTAIGQTDPLNARPIFTRLTHQMRNFLDI